MCIDHRSHRSLLSAIQAPFAARIATLVALLLLAGCESARQAGDDAALATGVTAMVVTSPLIPVVNGVRELSGSRERLQAKFEAQHARLDPIAERKIAAIKARNPEQDARTLYADGVVALLASVPGARGFPGMGFGPYDIAKVHQDPGAAEKSELYRELDALMNPYSADFQLQPGEPNHYDSPTFYRFLDAAGAYKATFNHEIFRLETGYSAPPPHERTYRHE